ncbi:hypothetical protein ACOME3_002746 [Neoechinorhynchus agilis]
MNYSDPEGSTISCTYWSDSTDWSPTTLSSLNSPLKSTSISSWRSDVSTTRARSCTETLVDSLSNSSETNIMVDKSCRNGPGEICDFGCQFPENHGKEIRLFESRCTQTENVKALSMNALSTSAEYLIYSSIKNEDTLSLDTSRTGETVCTLNGKSSVLKNEPSFDDVVHNPFDKILLMSEFLENNFDGHEVENIKQTPILFNEAIFTDDKIQSELYKYYRNENLNSILSLCLKRNIASADVPWMVEQLAQKITKRYYVFPVLPE